MNGSGAFTGSRINRISRKKADADGEDEQGGSRVVGVVTVQSLIHAGTVTSDYR